MKKKLKITIIVLALLIISVGAAAAVMISEMERAPDPHMAAEEYLNARLAPEPGGTELALPRSFELDADVKLGYRKAEISGNLEYGDVVKLSNSLCEAVNKRLAEYVEAATLASEIYNTDKSFKDEYLLRAVNEEITARMQDGSGVSIGRMTVELAYDGKQWSVVRFSSPLDGQSAEETQQELYAAATEHLVYVEKQYRIAESATAGPKPDERFFGSTDDPAVIETLLDTETAQKLMNGQKTAWNKDLEFVPGRLMRYYMDETILVLQWQEVTALAVGTYSEAFVADGSQLRRKLVNDQCGGYDFEYPTELARQANAVLAVGGDLYNHARACGIVVYDREIYRFEPNTCDTCYITTNGDMIYSKAGQFTQQEQAESFIEENDVLFSLCFGPVLIEKGQDVTPNNYAWGEINDTYARSSLGMLGEHHYLTMNINCEWGGYYYLAKLQQATEAMLAHGCITAYALDGGQTACTVFNGELINVVQFNTEKLTSDIVYFATALPEK